MMSFEGVQARLLSAGTLPEALDACWAMPGTAAGLAGPLDVTGVAEAAGMLAALAAILQERLGVAADMASEPAEAAACARGAAAAAEIGELFAAV